MAQQQSETVISYAKYNWKFTVNNRLASIDGHPVSEWNLPVLNKDNPVWMPAGIALEPPLATIESGTSRSGNAGSYANGSGWGRNIVGYRMPHSNTYLIVFFGTIGDIDDAALDPVARVKFIRTGSTDDKMVQLMSSQNIGTVDETPYTLDGKHYTFRATAQPPMHLEDSTMECIFTIESLDNDHQPPRRRCIAM